MNHVAFLLETKRLLIRPIKDTDLEPVFAYRNDPQVARYQGWDIPYPRGKVVRWLNAQDISVPTEPGGRLRTALELKPTGEMIGEEPFTTLTDTLDRAAFQGLLRRLYSPGLPPEGDRCAGQGHRRHKLLTGGPPDS